MKKMALLFALLLIGATAAKAQSAQPDFDDKYATELVKAGTTAPDFKMKTPDGKTVVDTTYVRTIDGVKPEMLFADYWIKEGHDQVLMTPEQIAVFNKNNKGC